MWIGVDASHLLPCSTPATAILSHTSFVSFTHSFPPSLLMLPSPQALTADTPDLMDLYGALFSCLQQARGGGGGGGGGPAGGGGGDERAPVFVELGSQQISLLDLLRLLRQRRRRDEEANAFVGSQLKRAEAVATQVWTHTCGPGCGPKGVKTCELFRCAEAQSSICV